jgi:hypothetical protein
MIGYASVTGTRRNLAAIKDNGWRLLVSPGAVPVLDIPYALDNGAWSSFSTGAQWDEIAFRKHVERYARQADFVVAPDIVGGGNVSLRLSLRWLPQLRHCRLTLLAVQDGMTIPEVSPVLRDHPELGLFLGGSTEWKLTTMYEWGLVAASLLRHYHVGRVNTARRIRLAAESGAHSFDGTSVSRYAQTMPLLESARRQPSLLSPRDS